jgi:hypothetical protein
MEKPFQPSQNLHNPFAQKQFGESRNKEKESKLFAN